MDNQQQMLDFLKNRFFAKYQSLVDVDMAQQNLDLYKKKLNMVGKMTKGVDFNKNCLFICSKDIAKELFLTGFSRLDSFRTFRYYNSREISNFKWGTREEGKHTMDDESINSNLDIDCEVLCMTINYYEVVNKATDEITTETVMNRSVGRTNHNNIKKVPRINWVFSMGTEVELTTKYPLMKSLFIDEGRYNFVCYDLNNMKVLTKKGDGFGGAVSKEKVNDLY